ncbi:MAG: hypothetical protein ACYTHK_16965 [Planctomycetota bacterium]|jgi:hypothetical protein
MEHIQRRHGPVSTALGMLAGLPIAWFTAMSYLLSGWTGYTPHDLPWLALHLSPVAVFLFCLVGDARGQGYGFVKGLAMATVGMDLALFVLATVG